MKNTALFFILFFLIYFTSVSGEDGLEARKKHHIKYGLYYGTALFKYLTFLAIKVKLVLVIGFIFTIIVFGGKLFALIKYGSLKESYHHHPEEVYYHSPHGSVEYIHDSDFHGPPEIEHPFRRFSTINKNNNNFQNREKNDNLAGYKRSMPTTKYLEKIMSFLMRLNLTERIFKEMKMDQIECRKKFVCETKFIAENSSLFRVVLRLMSDSTFESYEPNNKTTSIQQCNNMYPSCEVS